MNAMTPVTEGHPLASAREDGRLRPYARFEGPIVMIGFGSIGKGTLPLIERHIAFDRSKFIVIAPDDRDRQLLDERQIRFIHQALTKENYRELLLTLPPKETPKVAKPNVDTGDRGVDNFINSLGEAAVGAAPEEMQELIVSPDLHRKIRAVQSACAGSTKESSE